MTIESVEDVRSLVQRHGLEIAGEIAFNEMGLDYRIAFARDVHGKEWVLRIPRRSDLLSKIEREAGILRFVGRHLKAQVPRWEVCTPELIAYPKLLDPIALTYDPATYAVTWHTNPQAEVYVESLAGLLVDLHRAPLAEARAEGLVVSTSVQARAKLLENLERVKGALGLTEALESRWRTWLHADALWPEFSVVVHGDLYAGHLTAEASGRVTGVIDWSEAEVSDPSIDFVGHLAAFDAERLEALVGAYARQGGRVWPTLVDQVKERHAASPLRYAVFALESGHADHVAAAKAMLGVST